MEKPVKDRCDDDPGNDHEDEAAEQGIAGSEQFACGGVQFIDGTHAAEDHRGVQNRVDPRQVFDGVIADHANSQCDGNDERGERRALDDPAEERGKGNQRLMAVFKHGDLRFNTHVATFRRPGIDALKGSWDTYESHEGLMVTVRLLGNLVSSSGEHELVWNVQEPTPLRQLLEQHIDEIPEVLALLGQKEPECMLTVGIRIATNNTVVKDGDIIKVTPHNSQLHAADFPTWHGGTV